ncbi:MAG TPA: Ig-like domain-containing protein [Verrucomicrobiae bacterium]|nr:Ig-like domain-containing protein [Verrucomicrobiae bacterium]
MTYAWFFRLVRNEFLRTELNQDEINFNKTAERTMRKMIQGRFLTFLIANCASLASGVDLLQHYPTTLTTALTDSSQARPWQFLASDIFKVSQFKFQVGDQLKVETGPASLGVVHCSDGAVGAILIPSEGATLKWGNGTEPESVANIWLRFHPAEINKIFPPNTVSVGAASSAFAEMRTIVVGKFRASYQAGMNAIIPQPKDMVVDVDTKVGVRRFFTVDTQAGTAEYVNAFENQPIRVGTVHGSSTPPKILFTKPADGAQEVDPTLTEITVTFDQDMGEGMSWTGGGTEYPPSPPDKKAEWRGNRTCVLPVKLEPKHHYRLGINSQKFRNFCNAAGQPVQPSIIKFTTK